jgi:hypothetical protein
LVFDKKPVIIAIFNIVSSSPGQTGICRAYVYTG